MNNVVRGKTKHHPMVKSMGGVVVPMVGNDIVSTHSMRHRLIDAYETSRRLSDAYGHIYNNKKLSL